MSHRSQSVDAQPQSLPSPPQGHPELAQRIEKFQQAARDLLAVYEPASRDHDTGETRCYYFSPETARRERELLRQYRAEDFRGLLAETHMLLVGLVKMMKSTHHDVRVKGYVLVSLGCLLEQASSLVLRMKNVYDAVKPVTRGNAR